MTHLLRRIAGRLFGVAGLPVFALLAATCAAGAAHAAVSLRVEGRPPSEPIQVFVRVTNGVGVPITDLTFQDFEIIVDPLLGGVPEVLTGQQLTRPQSTDPDQHVSVVFVMDYSSSVLNSARADMETSVNEFIDAMTAGDMAAIIKFNASGGARLFSPFTTIDDGGPNDVALHGAVAADHDGDGSNILDATNLGLAQFTGVSLPPGPKAVILVTDGRDSDSDVNQGQVVDAASNASIPIFTIGVGKPQQRGLELLTSLAGESGGQYFDATNDGADVAAAYESVRLLLTGEYLIEIPNGIGDCATHQLQVTVQGETVTVPFTRRVCNTVPNAFSFTAAANVAPGTVVTSNTVTIEGIEAPAHISVIHGSYSIGCNGTFTSDPGLINDGETVCVQQTASNSASASKTTTLTVGGLAVTFTTTTRAQSGGGGGGGGGGSTGLPELLLLFGALALTRRRTA